jgi:hypothetical protein
VVNGAKGEGMFRCAVLGVSFAVWLGRTEMLVVIAV